MKVLEARTTRVLLQNTITSLYYGAGPESWTPRFGQAQDFKQIQSALETVGREKLTDVQVVLVIERESGLEFMPLQVQALVESPDRLALAQGIQA